MFPGPVTPAVSESATPVAARVFWADIAFFLPSDLGSFLETHGLKVLGTDLPFKGLLQI